MGLVGDCIPREQSMPTCTKCHTTDTPCWREGPEGARTLCNACGIRWKRLMGRTKRPAKRANNIHQMGRNMSGPTKPEKKVTTKVDALQRTHNSHRTRSISLPPEDTSVLSARQIMSMNQNQLLECILSRLDELEGSQNRTSLQVRVLAGRLTCSDDPADTAILDPETSTEYLKNQYEETLEQELDVMMNGDGENEAWLLATMRRGTPVTQIPFEQLKRS